MEILSPAKINLFLRVTSKRPDGYHNLVTLMCCIDWYDRVILDIVKSGITVSCRHPKVPQDTKNLGYAAAERFLSRLWEETDTSPAGVRIHIEKNIPVGAGLGGGSSNAAAVLSGLNHYYNKPFSIDQLMDLGRCIGADVPFLLYQKPALASGIGELLEPFEGIPQRHVVVVYPGLHVSTGEIFNNLNLRLTKCEKKLKKLLLKKEDFSVSQHLCNDLESVTLTRYPQISDIKSMLCRNGAEGALMTGSGSSVFGLFADEETARQAKQILTRRSDWQVYVAKMLT